MKRWLSHCPAPWLLAPALAALAAAPVGADGPGHVHGPDGRHIAAPGSAGGGGASILSHHDLKITDTRQPGPDGEGIVVEGCRVRSLIHRKGDPAAVIHREESVFEPETGVYGSHVSYPEPGEYVLVQQIAMPDGARYELSFPVWVPDPGSEGSAGRPWLPPAGGAAGALLLTVLAYLLGRRGARPAAALLLSLLLLPSGARAGGDAPGHVHGPDGRHIPLPGAAGGGPPLRAFATPDGKPSAVQTRDSYRFRLSIENEEMGPPDPDVVTLDPAVAPVIGLTVAVAREESGAAGLVATGRVRPDPNRMATVNAPVGGRVLRVEVTPGDRVVAGQRVALLESPEIAEAQAALARARAGAAEREAAQERARAEARQAAAELAAAEAAVERAEAEAVAARAAARRREAVLERQRWLAAAGAFAEAPVEAARAAAASAEGELRDAREALAHQEAEARRLEQGAADGVVARRDVEAARSAAARGRARVAAAGARWEAAREALAREERIRQEGVRDAHAVEEAEAEAEAAGLAARAAEAALTAETRAVTAARARRDAARQESAAAAAALGGAHDAVRSALRRLHLLGAAPGVGGHLAVRAPLAGMVDSRPVSAGEVVAAGQTLCTLLNTDTVWVESDIFEKDLPHVRAGGTVRIFADAVPGRAFTGTIRHVGARVDPETRAVRVRTVVANPDGRLKPNMFARVLLVTGGGRAVTVPRAALQEEGATAVLFVEEAPGVYRRRPVRAGAVLGDRVVIESGLRAGERVVTQGAYQLLLSAKGA